MSTCILFSNILKSFFSKGCVICKVHGKPCFSSRIYCSEEKDLLPNINTKESFLPKHSVDIHQICYIVNPIKRRPVNSWGSFVCLSCPLIETKPSRFYRIQGAGARDVAQLIEFCLECMKKPWSPSPAPHKTGMGANACHPSTLDIEAGASEVQGHSPVLNELEARQATGNSILKTSKQIKKIYHFPMITSREIMENYMSH